MDRFDYRVSRYDGAILFLPQALRDPARMVLKQDRARAEEIRLRLGSQPTILLPDGEFPISEEPVSKRDLEMVLDIATQASSHSVRESMRAGFVTVRGGYRIGVCGTAILRDGEVFGFKTVSSVVIRIARELPGISANILGMLCAGGFQSTLILSPPGGGKTTLLRDLIRVLSNGDRLQNMPGLRVSLADERSEVSAPVDGVPQMDIGCRTDVLTDCPKAAAVMMLLRSMNPEVIALDEITAPEDIRAMESAANCGVKLLATAHADDIDDLMKRALYQGLLEKKIFKRIVLIHKLEGRRTYEVKDVEVAL